jgi:hypothetical protein
MLIPASVWRLRHKTPQIRGSGRLFSLRNSESKGRFQNRIGANSSAGFPKPFPLGGGSGSVAQETGPRRCAVELTGFHEVVSRQ